MQHNKLIDEALEKYWRQEVRVACGNLDQANYESFKAGWQAARDHYAPRLTEAEVSINGLLDIIDGAIIAREGIMTWREGFKALAAAGVRFKQPSEGLSHES